MLTDTQIRASLDAGEIIISPSPKDSDIQPASVDVHIGSRFGYLRKHSPTKVVRLTDPSEVDYKDCPDGIVIESLQFVLGQLSERVTLNAQHVARIEGKSSNGRKGLAIHVTAGFVDPGWDGYLTVELFNASHYPYYIMPGDPIGQIAFDRLDHPVQRPYGHTDLGSHYQNSEDVRGSL